MKIFEWSQTAMAFWALTLALISLGWQIIAALYARFRQARLSVYVPGPVEISYNNFGPLFQLSLLVRSEGKDAFIEKIEAIVKNAATQEQHVFEARGFLEYRPDLLNQNPFPRLFFKESFSPFLVTAERPEKVTILFHDAKSFERMAAELNKANALVLELSKSYGYVITDELVDIFNKSQLAADLWSRAKDALYLKPGSYLVTIRTHVGRKIVDACFGFDLSDQEYNTLQLNAVVMTTLHKQGQQLAYNSIFPKIRIQPPPKGG